MKKPSHKPTHGKAGHRKTVRPSWVSASSFHRAGLPPGTLSGATDGAVQGPAVKMDVILYNATSNQSATVASVDEALQMEPRQGVRWINIDGLHDEKLLRRLGELFSLHAMVLEDIVNTSRRAYFDDLGKSCMLILKMITYDHDQLATNIEHVTLILSGDCVVSIQERPGDVFGEIRQRIEQSKGLIRDMGAEFLFFSLLDAIVDHYFIALDALGDRMTEAEEAMMASPDPSVLRRIHDLRRAILRIRKAISPLRDTLGYVARGESKVIPAPMLVYFRGVHEHTMQVLEFLETSREMLASLHDMHLALASNRMNEIMKVLTVFAAIFIPLTFVAGVYGMNFDVMPELHWENGYFTIWIIMLTLSLGMLVFFRRKKWF